MKSAIKFNKKYAQYAFLSAILLFFAAAIIIYPERYVGDCFEGFLMWAECVLPSLFPFMVITLIFVKTGIAQKASLPLEKLTKKLNYPPTAAACFLLSVCSGYPAGSRVLAEFYQSGALTKSDCAKLSYLCSTSGPLFIIGSVGYKMFADKLIGVKILLAHVLSVCIVSVIVSLFSEKTKSATVRRVSPSENVLYDTFFGAVCSVAVAGGFIAFFYVLANFAADFNLLLPLQKILSPLFGEELSSALCLGIIEATTGCRQISAFSCGKTAVALAGFLITFGGTSILLQQLCYLVKAGVKPFKFICVKLIQAVLCAVFLLIIV